MVPSSSPRLRRYLFPCSPEGIDHPLAVKVAIGGQEEVIFFDEGDVYHAFRLDSELN